MTGMVYRNIQEKKEIFGRYMEIFKRYVMLCVGLLIVAFGVAFSILADLGTSPISCPPYVASMLCPLTVGEATIVMHCIFILIQMALLRKNYDWVQLMQLPVAFAFGYMTDFACWCIADVPCPNYLMQVVWCLVGIVLVGIGVAFEVVAGVVTLAGEGLVLAICKAFKTRFDITKVAVDVSLVALACVASLLWLDGIHGVREGTLAAALLVGVIAQWCNKPVEKLAKAFGINI